jgi:DNA helicase-2/ATP-dependent DNA helicase PcrA
VLSYAESRRIHGQDNYSLPSRFLREIRANCCTKCAEGAGLAPGFDGRQPVMGHASIEAPPVKLGALVTIPSSAKAW